MAEGMTEDMTEGMADGLASDVPIAVGRPVGEPVGVAGTENAENAENAAEEALEEGEGGGEEAPKPKTKRTKKPPPDAAEEAEAAACVRAEVKRRRRKVDDTVEYHASPAPHHIHLQGLSASKAHPALRGTLLTGEPAENEALKIVHGPPGTGKSHTLLDALEHFVTQNPEMRCLVCGPTNVSAADLYTRAFARGVLGHLALSKAHMPAGVPQPNKLELQSARVVFSTVSGRSGRLQSQKFHAAFLDEAALVPEAVTWTLLRPDVSYLWMVGDLNQLKAQVSEDGKVLCHDRSLMERLHTLGVASHALTTQRRMHPEICAWPSQEFYPARSRRTTLPETLRHRARDRASLGVRDGEGGNGTSYENVAEADAALAEAARLREAGLDAVVLRHMPRSCAAGARASRSPPWIAIKERKRRGSALAQSTPPAAGFWTANASTWRRRGRSTRCARWATRRGVMRAQRIRRMRRVPVRVLRILALAPLLADARQGWHEEWG